MKNNKVKKVMIDIINDFVKEKGNSPDIQLAREIINIFESTPILYTEGGIELHWIDCLPDDISLKISDGEYILSIGGEKEEIFSNLQECVNKIKETNLIC